MAELTIRTNNHWRELLSWHDLTGKEQKEFDWIEDPAAQQFLFFRYRTWVHCLSNVMRINEKDADRPFDEWEGYEPDSFFSGIVVRFDADYEKIQIGTYFS